MTEEKFTTKISPPADLRPFYISMARSCGMQLSHYFMRLVMADLARRIFVGKGSYTNWQDILFKFDEMPADQKPGEADSLLGNLWSKPDNLPKALTPLERRKNREARKVNQLEMLREFFDKPQEAFDKGAEAEEFELEFTPVVAAFMGSSAKMNGHRTMADFALSVVQSKLDNNNFMTEDGGVSVYKEMAYKDMTHRQRTAARKILEIEFAAPGK